VPTVVIVGDDSRPLEPPSPIGPYQSVRNVDRGSVISEPSRDGLRQFLIRHALLLPAP
jgi:hypothetical protein